MSYGNLFHKLQVIDLPIELHRMILLCRPIISISVNKCDDDECDWVEVASRKSTTAYQSPPSSSSWRVAFSRIIPPLRFIAKTIHLLPAPEHRSPAFPCPGRSDDSRWWEVDLEHASSRVMAGDHLELRSRSTHTVKIARRLTVRCLDLQLTDMKSGSPD